MKLITESNFDVKTSTDDKKRMYIEGIFSTAEVKNKNGRIYPKNILEREITSIMASVNSNSCVGELNHPQDRSEVDLNESAIKITNLNWDGDNVMGKALVLSTPKGKVVEGLLNDGVRIGISSRALGTVSEGRVNDDLNLLTYDIVSSPSNHGSFVNGILEGVEFNTDNKTMIELKEELVKSQEKIKELEITLTKIKEEIEFTNKIKILESM